MIKFTPKQHQDYPNRKLRDAHNTKPSELTIKFIMGYAAALRVQSTKNIGSINILLN